MMTKIQLDFHPTFEDYLTVNRATTFNKPTLILIGLLALTTFITLFGWIFGWLTIDSNRYLFFILPPAIFIFFLVYTPINLRQRSQQMANQNLAITWYLSPSGISVIKDGESSKYHWDNFSMAQELESFYILFFKASPSNFIFLPKLAFESHAQEQHFRMLMITNIGKFK